MNTAIKQRRISIERMAQMWRYVTGTGPAGDLMMGDFIGLDFHADSFGEFIEINRANVQLYEEAV